MAIPRYQVLIHGNGVYYLNYIADVIKYLEMRKIILDNGLFPKCNTVTLEAKGDFI